MSAATRSYRWSDVATEHVSPELQRRLITGEVGKRADLRVLTANRWRTAAAREASSGSVRDGALIDCASLLPVERILHRRPDSCATAGLVIRDAEGTTVYDEALVPSLNEPTAEGTAGAWTIELRLSGYSGTLNFRVQKL